MPMMLDHRVIFSTSQRKDQAPDHQTYYGHPILTASRCGHNIHASASEHTPLCPSCVSSHAKNRMDVALKVLVAEGGTTPTSYMRDRRWQIARLRYQIAKKRQTEVRNRNQLREEREQAWEEAHQRVDFSRSQAAALTQGSESCPVCSSMVALFSSAMPTFQAAQDATWWEQLGALADRVEVPRTPPRSVKERRRCQAAKGSPKLRQLMHDFRRAMSATDAQREVWETRQRTELAVRRKHKLDETFRFDAEFWDSPISGLTSRHHYQSVQESQRLAARRARGNAPRPKTPCSSLSYSKHSEEITIDMETLEEMGRMEEQEDLEREARRVGGEVGYLYFVGAVDGMIEWREEYLLSDRNLVYRKQVLDLEQSETGDSEAEDSDTEDSDAEGSDEDAMDING